MSEYSFKSLRAEFNHHPSGARVNDVRVRRRMLIKESDQSGLFEELKIEWRSQFDRYNILTEDRQQLEDQFQQIGIILAKALQELPIDAAWGQVDPIASNPISTVFAIGICRSRLIPKPKLSSSTKLMLLLM